MIELGIENYKGIKDFLNNSLKQPVSGSKFCFIFEGDQFENNEAHQVLSNLFLDFFRGESIRRVDLTSLDHVMILSAIDNSIFFRHYAVLLKKSGTKFPHVELEEIGPSFEMTFRRTRFASDDHRQEALSVPRALVTKKKKNLFRTPTGLKARVHTSSQNFNEIATKKMKGLKRKRESREGLTRKREPREGLTRKREPRDGFKRKREPRDDNRKQTKRTKRPEKRLRR